MERSTYYRYLTNVFEVMRRNIDEFNKKPILHVLLLVYMIFFIFCTCCLIDSFSNNKPIHKYFIVVMAYIACFSGFIFLVIWDKVRQVLLIESRLNLLPTELQKRSKDNTSLFLSFAAICWGGSSILQYWYISLDKPLEGFYSLLYDFIIGSISILNSIFFLLAMRDFYYGEEDEPRWKKNMFFSFVNSNLHIIGPFIILMSLASIQLPDYEVNGVWSIKRSLLLDFIVSIYASIALGFGLSSIFLRRGLPLFRYFVFLILVIIFLVSAMGIIKCSANEKNEFACLDFDLVNLTLKLIYRMSLSMIFLILAFSYIEQIGTAVAKHTKEKLEKTNNYYDLMRRSISHRIMKSYSDLQAFVEGNLMKPKKNNVNFHKLLVAKIESQKLLHQNVMLTQEGKAYHEASDDVLPYLEKLSKAIKGIFDANNNEYFYSSLLILNKDTVKLKLPLIHSIGEWIVELVINAYKHGRTSEGCWVRLEVVSYRDILTIRVADNGEGFNFEEHMSKRRESLGIDKNGLMDMMKQVDKVGGIITTQKITDNNGTIMQITLPISQNES